jgi:hypothetical protein
VDKKGNKKIKTDIKTRERKQNEDPIESGVSGLEIFSQNGEKQIWQCNYHKPIKIDGDQVIKEIRKIFEGISFLKVVSPSDSAEGYNYQEGIKYINERTDNIHAISRCLAQTVFYYESYGTKFQTCVPIF